ncbi:MAG: UDP-3-O-acyl-N-acetylglucosamine deacetylase [Alphaproteobacteria bacterium]
MGIDAALQKTLKSSIGCTGTGLHSGRTVAMTLHPAAADTGIRFRRVDVAGGGAEIPADWTHVADTHMCTVLMDADGVRVATIEHLMAALAGCEIDNAVIDINGSEVPVMDGSAAPFMFLIECAGIAVQDAPRRAIRILKPIEIGDSERRMALLPGEGASVSFDIAFDEPAIDCQELVFAFRDGTFKTEIARARTFGFEHEAVKLRDAGLAKGASLENAVVVNGDRVLNPEGLRYKDEFVRHKILDCIGDLYLAGAPIIGHVHCSRSGHTLNNRLLRALFADESAWCYAPWVAQPASATDAEHLIGAASVSAERATAAPA